VGEGSAALAAGGQQQQLPALLQHVQQVMAVVGLVKEQESKVHVLRCWGQALQPCLASATIITGSSSSSSSRRPSSSVETLVPALEAFLVKVNSYSQPWQAEDLRGAAAEALHASCLLGLVLPVKRDQVDRQLVKLAVQGWGVLLQLMEDEEEDVRRQTAAVAATVLQEVATTPGTTPATEGVVRAASGEQAGSCCADSSSRSTQQQQQLPYVVVQQQRVFAFLTTCCGQQPGLTGDVLQLLTRTVLDPGNTPDLPAVLQRRGGPSAGAAGAARGVPGSSTGATTSSSTSTHPAAAPAATVAAYAGLLQGAGGRRLFDREPDNTYEEVVYTAQCAAAALVTALVTPGDASSDPTLNNSGAGSSRGMQGSDVDAAAAAVMGPWLGRLVKQLTALVTCLHQQQGDGWVGGVLSHPEVFVLLYRCLLGLAAAAVAWPGAVQVLVPQRQQGKEQQQQQQQQEGLQQGQQGGGGLVAVLSQLQGLQPPWLLAPLVGQLLQVLGGCSSGGTQCAPQQQQQQQQLVLEAVAVMGAGLGGNRAQGSVGGGAGAPLPVVGSSAQPQAAVQQQGGSSSSGPRQVGGGGTGLSQLQAVCAGPLLFLL
jgi:hypothetical protein